MEKINIAELLKDCPKGMELDCTMFDDVKFIEIEDDDKPICIRTGDIYRYLTKFGTWTFDENAKCVIFPKGKTTWEGFIPPCKFKDGDIVAFDTEKGAQLFIFKEYVYNHDYVKCYVMLDCGGEIDFESGSYYVERFATEKEKRKLFNAIKANGYKWNEETKTIEKLVEPKFKVGDKITKIDGSMKGEIYYTDVDKYHVYVGNYTGIDVFFEDQDNWELVPNKFDITTLKPFDKVLVRQDVYGKWGINFFGFYNYDEGYYYTTGNWIYKQCIPYEGNEYLLGTTDNCDNFYKTW